MEVSEGRSNQLPQHNSHFNRSINQSTYFAWLTCWHNYHDHWSLFCDHFHYHLQEHNNHWMKWCVVWEDLKWEIKSNQMNNHHILSNTAIWQFLNCHPSKETVSNDGRSKTSSFTNHNHISLSHSPFNENSSAYSKQ